MSKEAMKLALEALEPDWELAEWYVDELREKAITALREALASEAIEQPAPVAKPHEQGAKIVRWNCPCGNKYTFHGFTEAPPQRKPLTDEQLLHFVDIHVGAPSMAYPLDNSDWITFARAIEAAHGIKGNT